MSTVHLGDQATKTYHGEEIQPYYQVYYKAKTKHTYYKHTYYTHILQKMNTAGCLQQRLAHYCGPDTKLHKLVNYYYTCSRSSTATQYWM